MNISDVIKDIKLPNGLKTIALPYKEPIEIVVQDIIKTSVRTFSQFKPQIKECQCERRNLRYANDIDRMRNIYYIPGELCTTPVSYCDAYPITTSSGGKNDQVSVNAFTVVSPFVGFGSYYPQDIMNATITGAAVNKFTGVTSKVPTAKWIGYNKIQLINWPEQSTILFIAKCDHEESLETIPESCRESFIQLATLDVQRTLYNDLKNQLVGSAFKDIKVEIESWSGAEAERKALVKEWTESFHLDEVNELVQFF
jgi:hypothetical protein